MSLSTLLADSIADLFSNEDLTEGAVYKPLTGAMVELRVARRVIDKAGGLLQTGAFVEGVEFRILAADIAAPVEGDKIAVGYTLDSAELAVGGFWSSSSAYKIREALPDARRLTWRLDVQKAG
jgi:hypothetical protein